MCGHLLQQRAQLIQNPGVAVPELLERTVLHRLYAVQPGLDHRNPIGQGFFADPTGGRIIVQPFDLHMGVGVAQAVPAPVDIAFQRIIGSQVLRAQLFFQHDLDVAGLLRVALLNPQKCAANLTGGTHQLL